MREVTVESLVEFVKETDIFDLSDIVIFRGQPQKGNLVPGVARKNIQTDTTDEEKKVLKQLSLMGASLLSAPDFHSLELLVIAQHFGLKTRLLDWTSNPLAALWFACADVKKGDVFVYALESDGLLVDDVYEKDPFAAAKTRVFQPRLNNPRIIAQHGWFTLHRYAVKSKQFVPLEVNRETKPLLTEIRIPAGKRADILKALERHGMSFRTLFPDLNGLCQHLNWKYKLA